MNAILGCLLVVFFSLASCEPPVNNAYLPPQNGYNGPRNGNGNQNGLTQAFLRSQGGPQRNYGPPGRTPSGPSQNYGPPPQQNYGPPPSQNYGPPAASNQYLPPGPGGRGHNGNGDQDYDEPANYNFEYMVEDDESGNHFGHKESRQGDRAEGVYYVVLPDGRKQIVEYEADERGYRPRISYEDVQNSGEYNGRNNNGYNNGGGNGYESGPY